MIDILNKIEALHEELNEAVQKGQIIDYKIMLNHNSTLSLYIKHLIGCRYELSDEQIGLDPMVDATYVCDGVEEDEEEYGYLFKESSNLDISYSRRHLKSLIEETEREKNEIPVVSFYSYKGGVGRSTALASCASYLSIHHKKKVVIIDCDLEAPGFTNFFLDDPLHPINNDGIVEYLIDSKYSDEDLYLDKYCWRPSNKFSGAGEIIIFPAGNTDDEEKIGKIFPCHRSHYIEGLSRLDTMSANSLVEDFRQLFKAIKATYNPDVILIDSRTGFNDVFGIVGYNLSDIMIGFFGMNAQTLPGLHFFLDSLNRETPPSLIAVNAIIPSTGKRGKFNQFKDHIDRYLSRIKSENHTGDIEPWNVSSFYVSANSILASIGTSDEDPDDFINLIRDKSFPDFVELFEEVLSRIENISDSQIGLFTEKKQNVVAEEPVVYESELLRLKKAILAKLNANIPKLYAEDIKIEEFLDEFRSNRYFFRNCMVEIFNPTKILLIGNKGTGKSYIYRSLIHEEIVEELQKRANKKEHDYCFIHMVLNEKRFDTVKFDSLDIKSNDDFFERFWTVYIWNSIMENPPFEFKSQLHCDPIRDDISTLDRFVDIIRDNTKMKAIEADLYGLDEYLRRQKKQVIIIFDELDQVVKPIKWSERIAPLINYCRKNKHSSIHPKLFLRSDLYDKMTNLNNKNELKNRTISIEWNREELFAYFFKLILSQSKDEFFKVMRLYKIFPSSYTKKVMEMIEENQGQPPLDSYTLRHLCATFFGRYASEKDSDAFGETYEWFYKNLRNANDTISLRPFIDLINEALNYAGDKNTEEMPILPQKYYLVGTVRANAVTRHFNDLANEKGNEELRPIFEYIKDKAPHHLKKDTLHQDDMYELLDKIMEACKLTENNTRDLLIEFLTVNGVVRSKIIRKRDRVYKMFQFALLYKYFLGLRSKR